MDTNKIMIEAIQQEPALYGNNHSLEERNRVWKKLSSKLNIQEQYLKVRWHSLVQRYQSEVGFKYAQQMQFLQRKTITNIQEGNWPEFVITEEDLQDQQQDGEEFEFVELDEFDNVSKQIKEERDKEKEKHYANKTIANKDTQIKIVKKKIQHISQDKEKTPLNIEVIESVDTLNKHSIPLDTDEKMETTNNSPINASNSKSTLELETKKMERPMESKTTESSERENSKVPILLESTIDSNEYKKEEPKKIEPPLSRCEDDIFGELVSAMLKRMDEAKKKNVKKEIMNLLLS